jgi:hypothetical protein
LRANIASIAVWRIRNFHGWLTLRRAVIVNGRAWQVLVMLDKMTRGSLFAAVSADYRHVWLL